MALEDSKECDIPDLSAVMGKKKDNGNLGAEI